MTANPPRSARHIAGSVGGLAVGHLSLWDHCGLGLGQHDNLCFDVDFKQWTKLGPDRHVNSSSVVWEWVKIADLQAKVSFIRADRYSKFESVDMLESRCIFGQHNVN